MSTGFGLHTMVALQRSTTSDATIKKWRRTGLLIRLNETEERVLAHYLEMLMYMIMHMNVNVLMDDEGRKKWAKWLFPLQRRVFPRQIEMDLDGSISVADEKVDMSFDRFERFKGDFGCAYGIDFEVDFVKTVAEEIIRRTPCVPIWGMKIER